ncbi:24198_t:CDS:2 [Cetraspora pellucida]|uniref:24198_t:CDS:1 n=1 Tax=Cetraspora pellucida TaxID=1433469 RepID=A0A9N9DT90_9GLOM|nr:24198_t:CDS:2 [Cetraspora pellucida]
MARFKRLADSLNYKGPVIAMTDNTKVYPHLGYFANLGCIIGSVFSLDQTMVNDYNEAESVIQNIISNNAIAKQVRLYLLQIPLPKFPPVIIGLVPNNGNETSTQILKMHEKVLELARQLLIHIVSIGADGAISEFNAQKHLMSKNTGLTKTRLLTLGHYKATYDQVFDMCEQDDSVLYKKDVINCDRQDDGASYRLFCSSLLNQVINSNTPKTIRYGLFVYLFVIGELIDAYQNRTISHLERARMAMMAYFFLIIWKSYIASVGLANPNYISLEKNFLATQTFNILTSLAKSLAYMNGTLNEVIKDKTSGVGYITHYNTGTLAETINILHQWPSDEDLLCAVHEGYQQACDLAKVLSMSDDENDDFFDYFNDSIQSNEILDSHAIAMVANTVADSNTIEIRDDDIENDLRDARSELTFLLSNANFSNIHDLETCENFYTGITEAGTLDISYLVNLQKNHKCYSNQDMERKTICRIQNFNHINAVSPNMISSLIANRISNIEISQTEKLRGIQWKNCCRLSVLSSTNKKVDLNGITVANISEHNPLHKHGYGFSYINHEICLVQILALYQKNSNYHSYMRDDVFNIDSLSYLSVKVFFPLRNNIFSPLANSGYMVFSHINAKFFIYFLGFGDFIHVDEQHNLITLIGKALELYRFFNECSTKNLLRIIVHSEVKKD